VSGPAVARTMEGRVVLVTGAAAGVGRGVAEAFGAAGAIVGLGVRNPAKAAEAAAGVDARGGRSVVLRCDVTDGAESSAAIAELVERFGRLDALVHNAVSNRSSEPTDFETASLELWEEHASVTVRASYRLAVQAHPHLKATGGSMLLMTSPAGIEGSAPLPFYSAVKASQRGFVRALAREWGPEGIRINSVAPLAISPALENLKATDPERVKRIEGLVPLGWLGDPADDIGPPSVFLCSEAARYVTGQTLVVSGGRFTGL
jgi:NAD(P)-dependent dehydrogenase (short-subunit alcohol dehydrogenase family)